MGKRFRFLAQIIAMVMVIALFSVVVVSNYNTAMSIEAEYLRLEGQKQEEMIITADLNQKLSTVGSNEFIEKTAREKLGMVRPDERVYIRR